MTPDEVFQFMKTGQSPLVTGALIGGAMGAGLQARRLKRTQDGMTIRQQQILRLVEEHKAAFNANPTTANASRLALTQKRFEVATHLKNHPMLAILGSAGAGAGIGAWAGRAIKNL